LTWETEKKECGVDVPNKSFHVAVARSWFSNRGGVFHWLHELTWFTLLA
jgi:hypothetical protein